MPAENLYDDAHYLAAVIEAAGLLRPPHASQLGRLLGLLDDRLLRDCLAPSHNYTVGCAVLAAMTSLAISVNPRCASCCVQHTWYIGTSCSFS